MVMVLRDEGDRHYVERSLRLRLLHWFETQQRIIRRIATSLNVQLSAERLMRLPGEPDVFARRPRPLASRAGSPDEIRTGQLQRGSHHLS